jgi:hypothetical protein
MEFAENMVNFILEEEPIKETELINILDFYVWRYIVDRDPFIAHRALNLTLKILDKFTKIPKFPTHFGNIIYSLIFLHVFSRNQQRDYIYYEIRDCIIRKNWIFNKMDLKGLLSEENILIFNEFLKDFE